MPCLASPAEGGWCGVWKKPLTSLAKGVTFNKVLIKTFLFTITGQLQKFLYSARIHKAWLNTILIILGFLLSFSFFQQGSLKQSLFSISTNSLESPFVGPPRFSLTETSEFSLVQETQILTQTSSSLVRPQVLGTLASSEGQGGREEVFEYIVQSGDSLSLIASRFAISLNTLLWANDLSSKSVLRPGQKLLILPVSGVLHHVKKGETISAIAKTYKGDVDEMLAFNELSQDGEIFVGDILIIPGGVMPPKPAPVRYAPLATSYFICPISSPCRITQGLHWYNAIDFGNSGNSCGQPVFAAAGGQVIRTNYGYNRGAGNYIHVLHPNGVVTHYGHLESIFVSPGQQVSQGQTIGLIGYSGYTVPAGSLGCHLHFEVRGARNPFAY